MSRPSQPAILITCLSCVVAVGLLRAQSTDAIVSGTISDPSGAVVAEATVTARNLATGVVTTSVSNQSGVYVFPPLPPGKYDFTAEHQGFRKAVTQGVTLDAAVKLTLNNVLQLGATTETVEVQATASTLTASTASVGGTVEGRRLQDLPITGRDAMNFLFTQAGMGSVGTGFDGWYCDPVQPHRRHKYVGHCDQFRPIGNDGISKRHQSRSRGRGSHCHLSRRCGVRPRDGTNAACHPHRDEHVAR